MARPRTGGATSIQQNVSTPITTRSTPASSVTSTPVASVRPSRRAAAAGPIPAYLTSAPATPSPLADEVATPSSAASAVTSKTPGGTGRVERKAHALRSVGGAAQLVTSPFPGEYGGSEKCGVHDEDEADEVLMAVCGACATTDNRALSAEEVARIAFSLGWLRPPTAAVEPTSHINLAIRNHHKRCEKAARPPLLGKYQLTGAAAEQSLQSALHPDAFATQPRPKGTVYYLTTAGKQKWKNPFDGLELVKPPPKKVLPKKIAPTPTPAGSAAATPVKSKVGKEKKSKAKARSSTPAHMPTPPVQAVQVKQEPKEADVSGQQHKLEEAPAIKIKLRTGSGLSEKAELAPVQAHWEESRPDPNAMVLDSRSPSPSFDLPTKFKHKQKARRPSNLYDSSDESETSSEEDVPGPSCASRLRPIPIRKGPPAPINTASPRLSGSPRFSALMRLPSQGSPFRDLFFSPTTCASSAFPSLSTAAQPPAPAHPLDNEYWASRAHEDRYETSSSSSEDEAKEQDWGQTSGILIRGGDGELDVDRQWSMVEEEDEVKIRQATDALRALFPADSQEDEEMDGLEGEADLLRSQGSPRLATTMADSSVTARAAALRGCTSPSVALTTAPSSSSPIASPHIGAVPTLNLPDAPPLIPLSPARSPFEAEDSMEVAGMWLDESEPLPVTAEPDADSDNEAEVLSAPGDALLEQTDRFDDTAEWARETAVSVPYTVDKALSPLDYSSPMTEAESEDSDLTSLGQASISRSPSADALSPTSNSSDIEPCDLSQEYADAYDYSCHPDMDEQSFCGPESMTQAEMDEDEWMSERIRGKAQTPRKLQRCKSKTGMGMGLAMTACSKIWGSIGVGSLAEPQLTTSPARALRSTKILTPCLRSPRMSSKVFKVDAAPSTDADGDVDMDGDNGVDVDIPERAEAIGTADLELARQEAEEQEARRREVKERQAARNRALFEAYRQHLDYSCPSTPFDASNAFNMFPFDLASSVGSLGPTSGSGDATPVPTALATPTFGGASGGGTSPVALQSMSSLSLAECSTVNPRDLSAPHYSLPPAEQDGNGVDGMGGKSPIMSIDGDVNMNGEEGLKCNGDGVPCIPGMASLELPPAPAPVLVSPTASLTSLPVAIAPMSATPTGTASSAPLVKSEPMVGSASTTVPGSVANASQQPAQIPPAFVNGLNIGRPQTSASRPPPVIAPAPAARAMPTLAQAVAPAPAIAPAPKKGSRKAVAKATTAIAPKRATQAAKPAAIAVPTPAPLSVAASIQTSADHPLSASASTTPPSTPTVAASASASSSTLASASTSTSKSTSAPARLLPPANATPASALVRAPMPAPTKASSTPPVSSNALSLMKLKSACGIREGIFATVLANVPVFVHVALVKDRQVEVLRRLDTDWTNMTQFFAAAGFAPDTIAAILAPNQPYMTPHHIVESQSLKTAESMRVPAFCSGTWVPIQTARELAITHKIKQGSQLHTLLDADLFDEFRRIAKFAGSRGMSGSFGQAFLPPDVMLKSKKGEAAKAAAAAAVRAASATGSASVSPAPARAPSASNGAAQSTAPAETLAKAKAPLTRPAAGVPDGCPQPKRRRATVVGQPGIAAAARPTIAAAAASSAPAPAPAPATGAAPAVRTARPGVNTPASASAPTSPKGAVPIHPRLANPASTVSGVAQSAQATQATQVTAGQAKMQTQTGPRSANSAPHPHAQSTGPKRIVPASSQPAPPVANVAGNAIASAVPPTRAAPTSMRAPASSVVANGAPGGAAPTTKQSAPTQFGTPSANAAAPAAPVPAAMARRQTRSHAADAPISVAS